MKKMRSLSEAINESFKDTIDENAQSGALVTETELEDEKVDETQSDLEEKIDESEKSDEDDKEEVEEGELEDEKKL